MRICNICKENKPDSDFHTRITKHHKKVTRAICKLCTKKEKHLREVTNPELYPNYRRQRKYGIDSVEYSRIYNAQNGRCAICNTHQEHLSTPLHVDHDHVTKGNRGLLCKACNSGLGFFKDNPDLLTKAITYLKLYNP